MIIHIEICDVCRRIMHGIPTQAYSSAEYRWDVGPCCERKRFTVMRGAADIEQQLRARIEALVVTELSLMKDQV